MLNQVKIYLSYSDKDKSFNKELCTSLAGLKRKGDITILNEEFHPGTILKDETKRCIENYDLIIFLVSPDFIASDFINDVIIIKSIERYLKDEVVIVPILIRPCDFDSLILSQFQAIPKNNIPISLWKDRDEAWLEVIKQLKKIIPVIIAKKEMSISSRVLNMENQNSKSDKQNNTRKKIKKFWPLTSLAAAAIFFFMIGSPNLSDSADQHYTCYSYQIEPTL